VSTMTSRDLTVRGARVFTPQVFSDQRGIVVSPYQESAFVEAYDHRLFPVVQVNHSQSRRGVVRGIHFTATPPGTAKYVYCGRGRALDLVVDLRVGSPTFGRWDAVTLDPVDFRGVYLPVGVGHAFVALEDDTVVNYLMSDRYLAARELAVSPFDPRLRLPLPHGLELIVSERDQMASTLAEAAVAGLLPDYDTCRRIEQSLFDGGAPILGDR
jgi:5-epimerase